MTLRSLALASVATVALSTGASLAADLPMRTAAPAPMYAAVPVFTWTGFYIGVQAGGVWGRGDATDSQGPGLNAASQTFNLRNDGFLGGLHAGYNFQLSQSWVFGFEVEGNFGNIKFQTTSTIFKSFKYTNILLVVGKPISVNKLP